jgi:hypothetical protein
MPDGQPNGAVWAIATWQGKLYVAGGFSSIGGVPANGIAAWSPAAGWRPLGSGGGGGFSPSFFALTVFNDGSGEKLYAAGRFTSIGGVVGMIARWTGTEWEPLGGGVTQSQAFSDIESMAAFNDGTGNALYVGGYDLLPFQGTRCSVAKWNGQRWNTTGQYLGGRTTSLAAFNDGNGPALYAGGTAQPGINYIAKLTAGQWATLDGGVGPIPAASPFPSVFGLCAWNNALYVGGDFDGAGPGFPSSSGIVARTSCPPCRADFNQDHVVDFFDYLDFVAAFASQTAAADFNHDNVIDFFDYLDFVQAFSLGC